MTLTTLLSGAMAVAEVRHLSRNLGTRLLAWGLQALALLCLALAAWRALGYTFGPLLGPLVAALLLALAAGVVQARLHDSKRRTAASQSATKAERKDSVPPMALPAGLAMALPVMVPLLRPLLRGVLQPKRLVLLASAGALVAAWAGGRRKTPPRR